MRIHSPDGDAGDRREQQLLEPGQTSFTVTECRPRHPHEERFQGDFRTHHKKINNYDA
ncbi:hypothetical protein [Streptomyces avermitilis]|uniref:hypothetical protein n=1 Tax=Streptomyces avermitilis TaxID=33903 RepID=UPI0033A73CA2